MFRRTSIFALAAGLLIAACPDGRAASTAGVTDPASLLPSGFRLEAIARGDLDKDGDADVAMLGTNGPLDDDTSDDPGDGERVLVIARNDRSRFVRVGSSTKAVQCRRCGGAFFGIVPAEVTLTIARGSVAVQQSAGARELTDWLHRYRIEKGRARLIGLDVTTVDRATAGSIETSTNYLTGVTLTSVEGDTGDLDPKARAGTVKGKVRTIFLEQVDLGVFP